MTLMRMMQVYLMSSELYNTCLQFHRQRKNSAVSPTNSNENFQYFTVVTLASSPPNSKQKQYFKLLCCIETIHLLLKLVSIGYLFTIVITNPYLSSDSIFHSSSIVLCTSSYFRFNSGVQFPSQFQSTYSRLNNSSYYATALPNHPKLQ